MNQQQTYMSQVFMLYWYRGALVYDNSLSPTAPTNGEGEKSWLLCKRICQDQITWNVGQRF